LSVAAPTPHRAKSALEGACTLLLLVYFTSATFNQSIRIAGMQPSGHTQLWHIFHLALGLLCIFAVLSKRELGFWWITAIFVWQIPVESYGAFLVLRRGLDESGQIVEPFLNVVGLALLLVSRRRYGVTSLVERHER